MKSDSPITLSLEVNQEIHQSLLEFLDSHPNWDQNRIVNTSLSLFLIQNSDCLSSKNYQACSRAYLHSVCSFPE